MTRNDMLCPFCIAELGVPGGTGETHRISGAVDSDETEYYAVRCDRRSCTFNTRGDTPETAQDNWRFVTGIANTLTRMILNRTSKEESGRRNARPERPNGMKDDDGKVRLDLVPWGAIRAVAQVMTYGAKHYAANSWQTVPDARARYAAALQRHFIARFYDGEKIDGQWGLPHLAHMSCCALFLLAFDLADDQLHDGADHEGNCPAPEPLHSAISRE